MSGIPNVIGTLLLELTTAASVGVIAAILAVTITKKAQKATLLFMVLNMAVAMCVAAEGERLLAAILTLVALAAGAKLLRGASAGRVT